MRRNPINLKLFPYHSKVKIYFEYEKLGEFCFKCRIIGHVEEIWQSKIDVSKIRKDRDSWNSNLRYVPISRSKPPQKSILHGLDKVVVSGGATTAEVRTLEGWRKRVAEELEAGKGKTVTGIHSSSGKGKAVLNVARQDNVIRAHNTPTVRRQINLNGPHSSVSPIYNRGSDDVTQDGPTLGFGLISSCDFVGSKRNLDVEVSERGLKKARIQIFTQLSNTNFEPIGPLSLATFTEAFALTRAHLSRGNRKNRVKVLARNQRGSPAIWLKHIFSDLETV